MLPVVSVIIPVYNRSDTIAQSMESVLAQTFKDFELIIVDDGSTDRTREIIRQVNDDRIQLISHDHNLGAASARNTGMQAAVGKYIAWLDSDDEWLPEKLKAQLDALETSAPDQKASCTFYERIERNESRIYIPQHADYKKLFLGCDQAPGSTLFFDRTLLSDIGLVDISLVRYEDWDWLLRYCSKYRLLTIEMPLARIHYSPQRSPAIVEASALTFVSKYSEELRQFGLYRSIVISRRWMEVASYYAFEHDFRKIFQYLIKALLVFPFQPLNVWAWLINNWFGKKVGSIFSKGRKRSERY
ncbi:MAG: glycosyltransferase family 2 protein [Chloroflexi bacterium]|nr:glycosyltransferase family 2 protein [Chloroflexota bacterium]